MTNETTTPASYAWTFNPRTCVVLGHKIGCSAVPARNTRSIILGGVGGLDLGAELADLGEGVKAHPIRMCKCTK